MPPFGSTGAALICRVSCLATAVALAACDEPRGPGFEPSAAAQAAPRPALGPTAPLRATAARSGADAARLASLSDALAERRDAAQARAAALQGPVVDPALRERLLRAGAPREAAPSPDS